jgi:predicted PurR-regulated permease PerM
MLAAMDRLGAWLEERTPRRLVSLAIFLTLLWLFRHLLVLLLMFVAWRALLGGPTRWLEARWRWRRGSALLATLAGVTLICSLAAWFGVRDVIAAVQEIRATLPQAVAEVRGWPGYTQAQAWLHDTDHLLSHAQHYAADAVGWLAALGHLLVHAVVGLVLAVVYLGSEAELEHYLAGMAPRAWLTTQVRWLGLVTEAVGVTLRVQLLVAVCNAVLTWPVLWLLGLPHKLLLLFVIFVGSLVPVAGNLVSGAVLSVLAWRSNGWWGVALLLAITAALHKVEAYYLNPRLAARHVQLPGFLLVVSLVAWEHLLGLVGLLLSFPILYVAGRIRTEWRQEDALPDVPEEDVPPPGQSTIDLK